MTNDKANESTLSAADAGRDSPARTRDAFMPYGYGYSRSESRMGTGTDSPAARGRSPVNELEKGEAQGSSGAAQKLRRVLVREKGGR